MRAIAHSFISCSAFMHAAYGKNIHDNDVKEARGCRRGMHEEIAQGGEMCSSDPLPHLHKAELS